MSTENKLTRRLIIYAFCFLIVTIIINANMESHFYVVNSIVISNNLLLTLVGGVCTGITAVIVERIYKYKLDKKGCITYIYNCSKLLYAELYYWHRNILELTEDKSLPISEGLFETKVPLIKNYINQLWSIDYSTFFVEDKLMNEHNNFKSNYYRQIDSMLNELCYFKIAIMENKIENSEGAKEIIVDEYQVLHILDIKITKCMELVNKYIEEGHSTDSKRNWERDKKYIHDHYLGIYNIGTVKDFIERNS